jgi:PAS domain S-box-containing protein
VTIFRELFETAPDAMVVIDDRGTIVLANPQAEALFGHPVAHLVGSPVEILMPVGLRATHIGHRDRYMAAPRVRPMGAGQELIGMRADGTEFPIEIALSPIRAGQGRMFVASVRDISETHRARQALVRARYDAALAQIGQSALENPQGVLLDMLPGISADALDVDLVAIALVDVARGALQWRSSGAALPDAVQDWSPGQQGLLQRLFDDGRAFAVDDLSGEHDAVATALRGAGFSSAVLVPLHDLGRPMGTLLGLSRRPREFNRDAVHFLQAVANVLASAVLRQRSQDELAHVHRLDAIGQLTGGIAHDFNNLLTVISGNLQLLEADLDGGARQAAESALRAVGRGADLTRKLLAFARRQRLDPHAIDVRVLLADIEGMLRPTLGAIVELEIDAAPGVPHVFADPSQLESALVNLALNARDAMPRGGRLRIEAREVQLDVADGDLPAGDYLVFSVTDTGFGMSQDVLARAFEPFFTTKTSGKGSGLGLSIVYGFVKQSGGHLSVHSRLGYGTRIDLYLPAARPDAGRAAPAELRAPTGGNETVLVVEDEPEVLRIAVAFLASLGYRTLTATNAAEALDVLDQDIHVDLLFSDVVLGAGMTGGELGREARRRRPGLPVLLTSGHERPTGDGGEAPHVRDFELLSKPYRREALAEALRRRLDAAAG